MDIASLVNLLDRPDDAARLLGDWGLRDVAAGRDRLAGLLDQGLTLDLLATICGQLGADLSTTDSPDEVLEAFANFIAASRSPLALAALFERDRQALPMLLRVLGLGPDWRQMLVADPEAFDLLRMTDGQPVAAQWLRSEVCGELVHFTDERHILANLRRIKQRELLRIVYGDLFKRQRFELVTEQLSILADALLEATVQAARRKLNERTDAKRTPAANGRFSIIALGRLGGFEMDYQNRLQLLLVHEPLPDDDHARRAAREYFDRLGKLVTRYLSEPLDGQMVYSVETPIVLEHQSGVAAGADDVLSYLDGLGRTWHREAMTKARMVAGDVDLAGHVLRQLQPWIYRRYLNVADESGTRALKRRLRRQMAAVSEIGSREGEIAAATRQIEGVVQFLQLISGGDQPIVRAPNTLSAIAGLEQAGVLAVQERVALEDDYRMLRETEHRLQLSAATPATEELLAEPKAKAALSRAHETTAQLLDSAFQNDLPPPPEVDLLLDPQPTDAEVRMVLGQYGFKDAASAYHYLQGLANEHVPFLSARRCRYFLSKIAPQLLAAVASTPDPDYTLANLSKVSDSIGGKGVLWELFSFNPPSLQLYVQLCAASPYLSNILTSHPGMVDELVDSLQLARLATREELTEMLDELLRGNHDPLSLLHGFKHSHHLQIGVRELLGKDQVETTHTGLADVAEVCLTQLIRSEYDKLVEKFGEPMIGDATADLRPCGFAVLATGKLGGREPNYQSDVELIFVYEADGMTQLVNRGRREPKTANGHFFSQLAQRVIKAASQLTPWGRLYNVEFPLRLSSGNLAHSLTGLQEHFEGGGASFADWRALCRARWIAGDVALGDQAVSSIKTWIAQAAGPAIESSAIWQERSAKQQSASPLNLKRAPGGSKDTEFLVAALQLRHASAAPEILVPGALEGLGALHAAGILPTDHFEALTSNYRWLRRIDSALRLLGSEPRHDLPSDPIALKKLALLLRDVSPAELAERTAAVMQDNRQRMEQLLPIASDPVATATETPVESPS